MNEHMKTGKKNLFLCRTILKADKKLVAQCNMCTSSLVNVSNDARPDHASYFQKLYLPGKNHMVKISPPALQ